MLKELKRWIKNLRRNSQRAYDIPMPAGSPVNTISSWNYNSLTNTVYASTTSAPAVERVLIPQMGDKRIEKKPVDVVNKIIADKPLMDLNNLDAQIKIVQRRRDIMEEICGNTRDEDIALVFLKARRKYKKVEHVFEKWAVTNQTKIEKLCQEYKVMVVDFGGYSRNVPQEGIDQMELYFEAWSKVSDKKPCLKLIIDQGGKEQKKDPILLAQSPFGNWFYILGAWDKEIEIVDDLVYHNK